MTSSLVGSEMCIRDSTMGPPRRSRHHGPNRSPPHRAIPRRTRQKTKKPVSYTHLTLPTICSV
eukprot:7855207-Prorocentrum_lima.AAC.1